MIDINNFKCPKSECGSREFFIEKNGATMIGLYCSKCGKWIKWLNKDEHRLAEKILQEAQTNNSTSITPTQNQELVSKLLQQTIKNKQNKTKGMTTNEEMAYTKGISDTIASLMIILEKNV